MPNLVKDFPAWALWGIASALSAALVPIFGKIGVHGINSTLATFVRSVWMTLLLGAVALSLGDLRRPESFSTTTFFALALSGAAGALSWLFYYKALQVGAVRQVAPLDKLSLPLSILIAVLFFGEEFSPRIAVGLALMVGGAWLVTGH